MSSIAPPNPNMLKQGDTVPLQATLRDDNGPVNLAGATVEFRMKSRVDGAGHAPIAAPAEVLQAVDMSGRITNRGVVQYEWGPGETDIAGVYGCEFAVTFPAGTTRTFPNDRSVSFEIIPAAE